MAMLLLAMDEAIAAVILLSAGRLMAVAMRVLARRLVRFSEGFSEGIRGF